MARLAWPFARRSIPNSGSTARDHLANERTWLAWTRTSLGLIALGLGWERFELLREDVHETILQNGDIDRASRDKVKTGDASVMSIAPSALLLGAGALLSLQSTVRYYRVASALAKVPSHFIPARGVIRSTALLACSFSAMMLFHQVGEQRRSR